MSVDSARASSDRHVEMVRAGFVAADEATVWMGETVARGITAEVLDVRALDESRVLILLQRNRRRDGDATGMPPEPHGQIVTFRGDQVAEIVVYPSDSDALEAAGDADAAL